MPWTPIAVRAWRTSSSLKGLMIATTSFMGSGLHSLSIWQFACRAMDADTNLASFCANGTKKLQILRKTFRVRRRGVCTGDRNLRQNAISPRRGILIARLPQDKKQPREHHVESILVLCLQRPATGPFGRRPIARPDRPRGGPGGYAG